MNIPIWTEKRQLHWNWTWLQVASISMDGLVNRPRGYHKEKQKLPQGDTKIPEGDTMLSQKDTKWSQRVTKLTLADAKKKRCWCPYSLPFSSSCTYIKSVRRPPPWRNINTPMWADKRQTHARLLMLGYYAMSFQGQMSSRPMCHGIVGIHLLLCHPEKWTKKAFKGAFNPKRLAIGIHKSLFFCTG